MAAQLPSDYVAHVSGLSNMLVAITPQFIFSQEKGGCSFTVEREADGWGFCCSERSYLLFGIMGHQEHVRIVLFSWSPLLFVSNG